MITKVINGGYKWSLKLLTEVINDYKSYELRL